LKAVDFSQGGGQLRGAQPGRAWKQPSMPPFQAASDRQPSLDCQCILARDQSQSGLTHRFIFGACVKSAEDVQMTIIRNVDEGAVVSFDLSKAMLAVASVKARTWQFGG
jgi:hypothetical protein